MQPGEQGKNKPRTVDVVSYEPQVYEWVTRMTPPPGLAAPAPPKDEVVPLGPVQLREHFAVEKDGTVVASLRVDITKSRYTVAEVEATRAAGRELVKREAIVFHFANVGRGHADAGRVREALVEFRRLAALHPKEALHHEELAETLLKVGLTEAARAEAARAVALEPNNLDALL